MTLRCTTAYAEEKLPPYKAPDQPLQGAFLIEGSGVMAPMIHVLTKDFLDRHQEIIINSSNVGSGPIPARLLSGDLSIGMMSRALSSEEKADFREKYGRLPLEIIIAHDALEIVVHPSNPLSGISLQQLDGIYSSAPLAEGPSLKKWGDLGLPGEWADRPITIYGGSKSWGTTRTFENLVTRDTPSREDVVRASIEAGIPTAVADNPAAIGYTTKSRVSANLKSVPVAAAADGPLIDCTRENLQTGTYPLTRSLFLYVSPPEGGKLRPVLKEFLDFVLSQEGQDHVASVGLAPLTADQAAKERTKVETYATKSAGK